MQYGYRKKTCTLRLTCSVIPVQDKIANLPSLEDRRICMEAYTYLINSPSSSYKEFLNKRDNLFELRKEPNIFDVYTWAGIECALWPNLYPFTSWSESIQEGGESRKSSKISCMAKCLSPIIDYSHNY